MAKLPEPGRAKARSISKNPMNQAVGRLVARCRSEQQVTVKIAADAFNVSESYQRAIEAGIRALPAYAATGLVERLGFSWTAASSLVAMVSFLDARAGAGYSPEDLRERIQRLRTVETLRPLLDILENAVSRAAASEPYEELIVTLRDRIPIARDSSENRTSTAPSVPASASLSPVLEDIVELFSTRLTLFAPHVNKDGFKQWETRNSGRIGRLYGFVESGTSLRRSLGDFDWSFVWNRQRPLIRILVRDVDRLGASELVADLRRGIAQQRRGAGAKLPELLRDLEKRVFVSSAHGLQERIDRTLWFDFVDRSMPSTIPENPGASGRRRRFSNAWIYDLEVEGASRQFRSVGFMDAYDEAERAGYAVALDRVHISAWLDIFSSADTVQDHRVATRSSRKRR